MVNSYHDRCPVAAKRLTDSAKWRNEWFRTLPLKARLTWIYLCDECDYCGVWKADCGLATFQLGFSISLTQLTDWFTDKIHLFDSDKVLIIQFFEFQYGESKDTWSAKANAKKRLESLGFNIIDNKVKLPTVPDSGGQSGTLLSNSISKCISNIVLVFDFEKLYDKYPDRPGSGKPKAFEVLKKTILTQDRYDQLDQAVTNYANHCKAQNTSQKFIKMFSTFIGPADKPNWVEWIDLKQTSTEDKFAGLT